jgi:hypothetical protein
MNSQEELELNEEEIEYLMLKYIQEQTKNGKEYVEASELYAYLGAELPEDMENEKIVLKSSASRYIREFEAKYRPYLN